MRQHQSHLQIKRFNDFQPTIQQLYRWKTTTTQQQIDDNNPSIILFSDILSCRSKLIKPKINNSVFKRIKVQKKSCNVLKQINDNHPKISHIQKLKEEIKILEESGFVGLGKSKSKFQKVQPKTFRNLENQNVNGKLKSQLSDQLKRINLLGIRNQLKLNQNMSIRPKSTLSTCKNSNFSQARKYFSKKYYSTHTKNGKELDQSSTSFSQKKRKAYLIYI